MAVGKRHGLVIARHRRKISIEDATGETCAALVRGRKLRPLTGDRVLFTLESDGTSIIREVLPRDTLLERVDSRGRGEGIAANVSLIAVVLAPKPDPDWQLVDRYLVAAELLGIDAALIRNKVDIVDATVDDRVESYRNIGYALIATSAKTGTGIEELGQMLRGRRGVLVGQSGVGKSSLINALLARKAQTVAGLSRRKPIGRHTTTAAVLYRLPGGGELIDSPGVRRYAPKIAAADQLASGFVEFRRFAGQCRFGDCRHRVEPDCAVRAAVDAGSIGKERYSSYLALSDALAALRRR
jgi:ribosome biogenesis GTPase